MCPIFEYQIFALKKTTTNIYYKFEIQHVQISELPRKLSYNDYLSNLLPWGRGKIARAAGSSGLVPISKKNMKDIY